MGEEGRFSLFCGDLVGALDSGSLSELNGSLSSGTFITR